MGIFDKFKKNTEETKKINRIDELANKLMKEGKTSLLEDELKKISLSSLSEKEQETWYEMYGIAAFQKNDRAEAMRRLLEAHKRYPDSSSIAFSLGQEYEHVGNVTKMVGMFDKAPFPKVSARHNLWAARYCYLWDRHDKAIEYLMQFFKYFKELKIMDYTFLYLRGLPFYSEVWGALGASFELTNNLSELVKITRESQTTLSDYPFDDLIVFLESIQENDFDKALKRNNKIIEECKKNKMPTGYIRMQEAVLRALVVDKMSDAERILDEVELASNDFPWLKDMRLLAQCSLASKFCDVDKENTLKQDFISKQRLLFEPEHVFTFRLVSYQESLKREYQNRIKSAVG